jgi:ComF family protein
MVYRDWLDWILPEYCPRCRMRSERGFCRACRADFARVARPCPRCGLAQPVSACPGRDARWQLDAVVAPFTYTDPLRTQLQDLKFHGARSIGRAMGLLLAEELVGHTAVDAVVAVPLHRQRLITRGYNQADEIARTLARELGIRTGRDVRRLRPTAEQARLGASERAANVRGAFSVSRDYGALRVAIVDDVMTTGATLNALATALRAGGARSIVGWSIARTLAPHPLNT